jgi:antitoxin component of MazEF toxin-antitoxin module
MNQFVNNHHLETRIRDIVATKVKNGEMFTAHDIAKLIDSKRAFAYISQVKPIVDALMRKEATYTSEFRTFGLTAFPAVVYYPLGADVSIYHPNKGKQGVSQASSTKSNPNVPSAFGSTRHTADDTADVKIVKVGSGNRVRVPADSIRKLGLKAGDKAYVNFDGNNITISADKPRGKSSKVYTVDMYDNLLLRLHFYNPAVTIFKAKVQGSKVVLEAN